MHQSSMPYRRLVTAVGALCLSATLAACDNASAAGAPNAVPVTSPAATVPAVTPTEAARSVPGVPGALFYESEGGDLVRRTIAGELLPVANDAWRSDVSTDGRRTAFIEDDGDVMVTARPGDRPKRVYRHAAPEGIGPAWSPDGTKLLIGRAAPESDPRPGVLEVATGRFTALPKLQGHLHFRWSGDGQTLAFATGECRLLTSAADGNGKRLVPVVGDENRKNNPSGSFACDVVSVNRDGTRLAVDLKAASEPGGDITGDIAADTVIDTATGATVALPVRGQVLAVLYRPDGSMLVRSRLAKVTTLTVLSAEGTQIAQVAEPTALRKLTLAAWTR
jgi:TolB protein